MSKVNCKKECIQLNKDKNPYFRRIVYSKVYSKNLPRGYWEYMYLVHKSANKCRGSVIFDSQDKFNKEY